MLTTSFVAANRGRIPRMSPPLLPRQATQAFLCCTAPATTEPLGPVNSFPNALGMVAHRQVFRYNPDRSSDDVAGDDHLHAAILLTSFHRIIGCNRLRLTESSRRHRRQGNVLLCQVIPHCTGSLFREFLIHGIAAHAVGVALDR